MINATELTPVLNAAVAESGTMAPRPVLTGVNDLSVPILSDSAARAALTIPFMDGSATLVGLANTRSTLCDAAAAISTCAIKPAFWTGGTQTSAFAAVVDGDAIGCIGGRGIARLVPTAARHPTALERHLAPITQLAFASLEEPS